MLPELNTLFTANASQAKALTAVYQTLVDGVPNIGGYTALIEANNTSNFGAGTGPVFNDENIFINIANSLIAGNATATAKFATLSAGSTLKNQVEALYNALIPVADQTDAGREFMTRPDALAFYTAAAAERGITSDSGPAIIAFASILKVTVDGDIGVGNAVNDLIAAVKDGSAVLPDSGDVFTPIENADGSNFDNDDAATGTARTLTTGVDIIDGSAGDDVYTAVIDAGTAANSTLTAADTVNGAAGVDTLKVVTQGAAAAGVDVTGAASIGGDVEVVEIRAVHTGAQNATLSGTSVAGLTMVNNNMSTNNVVLSNIADTTKVQVGGNGVITNGNTTVGHVAAATSAELTADSGVNGGNIVVTGTGITTMSIASTGAANKIGTLTGAATTTTTNIDATTKLTTGAVTNAGKTINVMGAGAVDLSATALEAAVTSLDASANTGGLTAALGSAVTQTVKGGTGNDSFTTGAVLTTGTVDAGAGTDTLTVSNSTHLATSTLGGKYTNFETLGVTNGVSVDLDNIAGITAIEITDGAGATAVTDLSAAQAGAVTIKALAGAATIGVKNATQVATDDTLSITVSDGDTTASEALAGTGDLTIAGVETINITATDDLTLATMANVTGMTKLNVSGEGDVSITTGAMAVQTNTSVDFSGLTKASTFNFAAATGNALGFVGGAGVDTVTDSVVGGNVIAGGAGNDVFVLTDKTGGTTFTTVEGGAGADATTVNMLGNVARDGMKFVFKAGDSVSDSSTSGISATTTDTINNLDGTALGAAAGSSVTFDTEVAATAVTAGTTDVVLGTTTVTNAGDFFVNIDAAATTWIYQDTDGDKIIESGEFAVALTGIQNSILAAGEFTVSGGDLILATA